MMRTLLTIILSFREIELWFSDLVLAVAPYLEDPGVQNFFIEYHYLTLISHLRWHSSRGLRDQYWSKAVQIENNEGKKHRTPLFSTVRDRSWLGFPPAKNC